MIGGDIVGKTSSAVKSRWNAKTYDQVPVRVPKGCKRIIESAASAAGESVNGYIQRAILERMGMDTWPTDTPGETQHLPQGGK